MKKASKKGVEIMPQQKFFFPGTVFAFFDVFTNKHLKIIAY